MKGEADRARLLGGLAETVAWVAAFCFASTSMTMLNKAAVKALPFPYWLCVLQNIATILLVGTVVSTCVPSGHPTFGLVRSLDWEVVRLWIPAVVMFIIMLVSSLSALHAVSVPTVLVFRSLTPPGDAPLNRNTHLKVALSGDLLPAGLFFEDYTER